MYQLVYGSPRNHVILARSETLFEIAAQRQVSGDLVLEVVHEHSIGEGGLVIDQTVKRVVAGDLWWFDWERENPDCYVQKVAREGWRW